MRGTARLGSVAHVSVAGSQISGVMTALEMTEEPSTDPPIAITRPSGSSTVLNFLRLNLSDPTLRQVGVAALRSMTQDSVPLWPMLNSSSFPDSYMAIPPPPGAGGDLVTVVQRWVSTSMYADLFTPFLTTKIWPLGPTMARG